MRWRVLSLLLLVAVIGGLGGRAAVTTSHPFTLEELTYVADRILIGTVLDTEARFTPDARTIFTHVEIEVDEVLKGPADLQSQEVLVLGGEVAGFGMHAIGSPEFDPGEQVLLFLEELDHGMTVLGWEQGKFSVEHSPELGQAVARRGPSGAQGRGFALAALRAEIVADVKADHVPEYREIPGLLAHKRAAFRAHWGLPQQEVGR